MSAQVNRYLDDKNMDHIDHALGRPVDPIGETYRNYFYVIGDTELRRHMALSRHWTCTRHTDNGAYFAVTREGRQALADHLKTIGDRHRLFVVSWGGYDMTTVAETAAQAKYRKWQDVSDVYADLTFGRFQKSAKVRLA